jgi:hypothetical protein
VSWDHLGFLRPYNSIKKGVFVPRYYNPEVWDKLTHLKKTHDLLVIGDLIVSGQLKVVAGHEIGKMAYGTGQIPFVRTSDISNWEIKIEPKQGVSQDIYDAYRDRQDVKQGDIFFVRDGTYLVGQTCMVTEYDLPCLFQSHVLRFRLNDRAPINRYLFLATMNSPAVKLQIRACQFTADIIDTVGNRYYDIVLPIPRNEQNRQDISDRVKRVIDGRAKLREVIRRIPLWAQGIITHANELAPLSNFQKDKLHGNFGFLLSLSKVNRSIFIPRYYDPDIGSELRRLAETHELISLGDLVKHKVISWSTGVEPGKMAYGTGLIPFIRTSDISNWEVKADPKQGISEEIYQRYCAKQDVQPEDIFVVRDGTYLVGTSCIITKHDTKIVFCGGLYKLRVANPDKLDPYLLLALLNTPVVKRQMRAKQFTRDIIDTLGKRLFEVILPIPKDVKLSNEIANYTRKVVQSRIQLRNEIKNIALEVEGLTSVPAEAEELLEAL